MKKIIFCFFLSIPFLSYSQEPVSVFHRLLVYNADSSLMLVKIKDTDLWATPGVYQKGNETMKKTIDDLASSYGLKIPEAKLSGTFTLMRTLSAGKSLSVRNVYSVFLKEAIIMQPSDIEAIEWVPVNEALSRISFPHISHMVKHVFSNPDDVWGGSLTMVSTKDGFTSEILEEFYPLR